VSVFEGTSTSSSGNHTRPRVAIDADNRRVHVAAAEITASAPEVHARSAPISTMAFGEQHTIFRNGTSQNGYVYRDVHAGQQPVTATSGLLWLARGREVIDGALGSFSLWQSQVAIECLDDAYEPNSSIEQAAVLSSGEQVDAKVCGGDVDYFSVDAAEGETIAVRLEHDARRAPLNATLSVTEGDEEVALADTNEQLGDVKTLSDTATSSGPHYVAVRSDGRSNEYTLSSSSRRRLLVSSWPTRMRWTSRRSRSDRAARCPRR
jgi:hypothetical protein